MQTPTKNGNFIIVIKINDTTQQLVAVVVCDDRNIHALGHVQACIYWVMLPALLIHVHDFLMSMLMGKLNENNRLKIIHFYHY